MSSKISDLTEKLKHDKHYAESQISKNCNSHLLQRIIQLERNAVTNVRYHRSEKIETNPIPEGLRDKTLQENVCKALPLTGVNITPEQRHLAFGVFIVNFEHFSHLVLVFLLLTLTR